MKINKNIPYIKENGKNIYDVNEIMDIIIVNLTQGERLAFIDELIRCLNDEPKVFNKNCINIIEKYISKFSR